MDEMQLRRLLEAVRSGELDLDAAVSRLRALPYENVDGIANLDLHRTIRRGFPEVVFAQGKAPEHLAKIITRLVKHHDEVLVTRLAAEVYEQIRPSIPEGAYYPIPRMLVYNQNHREPIPGVLVVTAGTADIPVAEEAALTAELTGSGVERLYDVGVAGLHRLLDRTEALQKARVVVVVAGMEGALASVVGGLVSAPVISVPTSVGYGASFQGLAALLSMLNSCSPGMAVVNIDNGFGAGYLAGMINRMGKA